MKENHSIMLRVVGTPIALMLLAVVLPISLLLSAVSAGLDTILIWLRGAPND